MIMDVGSPTGNHTRSMRKHVFAATSDRSGDWGPPVDAAYDAHLVRSKGRDWWRNTLNVFEISLPHVSSFSDQNVCCKGGAADEAI
jgi:hypothetical protein